ncbi:MAG: inorganic phosphate transporter [Actinobacteria bacterium]|nr:inorganic phosphate transporter [Actinomycetota bacterium]
MLAAAGAFTVISGVNDGSALLTSSLSLPSVRPLSAMLMLAGALIAGPYVIGTQVATTLASRLVAFEGVRARVPLLIALVAAVGVVAGLSRLGLPTSLTLALIGGLAGSGFGYGLPVSWGAVGFVLAVAAAAPVVGGLAGFLLMRLLVHVPSSGSASMRLRWLHRIGFSLQSIAYSVNDGQKLLAVFAVGLGATSTVVQPRLDVLGGIAALFVLGMLLGIRRIGGTLGTGVMLARPAHLLSSELSSAAAVLGSTALGAPVSMTQSITASLVGTGVSEGYGRVRWRTALNIGVAWLVTLPAAGLLAALISRVGSTLAG